MVAGQAAGFALRHAIVTRRAETAPEQRNGDGSVELAEQRRGWE
jgi:hypothetical protein